MVDTDEQVPEELVVFPIEDITIFVGDVNESSTIAKRV
jgi:hypothetical protein